MITHRVRFTLFVRTAPLAFVGMILSVSLLAASGCGGSAREQHSADALKQLGALVIANPLDGTPAQSLNLGMSGVKDKLDEAMPHVAHLRRMEALTLDGAPATDSHLEHIKGLTGLHGLVLSQTKVTDAGVAKLVDLDELEKLELAQTEVTEACLPSIAQLDSLNTINLSGTKVRGDLAPLAEMPHLEWVLLIDTEISDAGLATLARAPKLSRLSIGGAKLNEAALEAFQQAKPGVSVNR
jgi:hypothetical protein